MVQVGDVLVGKYKVEKTLGKGGMGYVVAARHLQLDQGVAIKILLPELAENPDAVARFLREARAAARIRSNHIVHVLDVGTLDDGPPFMVMELLEGTNLAKDLERRTRLSVSEAVDDVLQVCEGLAEAHAAGIIHRDLKPANLFRTHKSDGSELIKILDFGISKALIVDTNPGAPTVSQTQGLMGSPHYMSPEQVRKPKTVNQRSDIWALGVILYECLTGTTPFASETPMAILAAVVSDDPPEIQSTRFDVPETLQAVVSRCLSKDPSRRYADVVELALALKPFSPETGEASFNRISAILRSAKGRSGSVPKPVLWPSDAPTLESGSAPPTEPDDKPRHTAAGWGSSQAGSRSQPSPRQSRARLAATVTAALAMFAFAAALGYTIRGRPGRGDDSVSSATGPSGVTAVPVVAPQQSAIPVAAPQPAAVPVEKPAAVVAGDPTVAPAVVDAGVVAREPAAAPPARPAISASPSAPRPSGSIEKASTTKREDKAAAPKPHEEKGAPVEAKPADPLDGRR